MTYHQNPVKNHSRIQPHIKRNHQSRKGTKKRNMQYWKKIAAKFIKQKHNSDTSCQKFLIKMYSGGPPHEHFFIILTLKGILVIRPTKKLVALYVVVDLSFLD